MRRYHILFLDRGLSSGEFLPYKWKILNSGELLPYKWRILNSKGALAPLFSYKDKYQIAGKNKVIKKSIVPIIRIVVKNMDGEKELKGTLRISHMIPVPASELELYDLENESDSTYKDLVHNEMIFIRKQREKIISNAKVMYKQKASNDTTAAYVKSALDFQALEELCDRYEKAKEVLNHVLLACKEV